MNSYDVEDSVMMLHHIARTIERIFGYQSPLANDIRNCADRLNQLNFVEK